MTPDEREHLYTQAEHANRKVVETGALYQTATLARALIFRALRRSGESSYRIAARLGMNTTRVEQIVARGEREKG